MTVEFDKKCHLLADKIAELLCEKTQAGPDVMDYIDSTHGNPAFEEIKALIEEQEGSERETLVELIFFPDESVQVQLEDLLEKHTCTPADVATIAAALTERKMSATVALGDTGQTLNVRVDRNVIDPYLTRLNIAHILNADLSRTIAEVLPADWRSIVKVHLRNARIRPTGTMLDFLDRFIRQSGSGGFFIEDLDFLLEFLHEIDDDGDIFDAMMKKKRRCRRHLNKVEGVEEKLRKTNVEILLSRGERFPHIDRGRILKTIAAIDRICRSVFGRTDTIEAADTSAAGIQIGGAKDAVAMIRRLSS